MSNEFDYKLKLILVGDTNVGKSSFFNILKNEDTVFTSSTVGVDFTSKIYHIKNNKIKITIWDTGGQEKYECIVRSYFRELSCVILMFDLTKIDSFNNLEKWLKLIELENHCDHNHSILLLGNKKDINNRVIFNAEIDKFIASRDIMYRDVSCKTDNDLENIFIVFIEKILSNEYINNCKGIQLTDDKKSLIDIKKNKKNKNKCCYII
jgi:Ras-related protein Rab-11A